MLTTLPLSIRRIPVQFGLLCVFAGLLAASSSTYYVGTVNCSDSFSGSSTQPWCTIGHASKVMAPGDTVIVLPGVYHESIVPQSGTADAYITYQGQPGAVLDGTGTATQAFDINNVAYLNISGFEVTNYKNPRPAGNSVNIHGTSHHINLANMLVHDNWNGIIMQDDANQIDIRDSVVFNSRYGIGFENTVHDITIDGAVSHDNSEFYIGPVSSYGNGDGYSDDAGTYNLTISNSQAYRNQDGGFDIRAVNFSCTNCVSHDNTHYGFRIWDSGGPYTMVNSLAYGNGWGPLQVQALGPKTYFYNCTFSGTPTDHGYMMDQSGSNIIIRNTIFAGFTKGMSDGSLTAVDDDYSLYSSSTGTLGFAPGPHSLKADPLFAGPAYGNYRLQPQSPAIDAGTALPQVLMDLDANSRPAGKGFDIGAYEFNSTPAQAVNAPAITGIVNGASFQAGVAPGAWISIFGTNLAPIARNFWSDEIVKGALPTLIDGVSVTIDGKPAAVGYISPTQINVQVPDDGATGPVDVLVTNARGSAKAAVAMQPVAPGFFTYAPNNGKYIAAQHADGSVVGPAGLFADVASTPAKFGEVIQLYATGFGPTNPTTPSGQLVTTPAPIADLSAVTALIGGMRATVTWAGVTMAGLWQINVQVPSAWLDGDKTVIATIGGQQTQGQAYLSVQRQ